MSQLREVPEKGAGTLVGTVANVDEAGVVLNDIHNITVRRRQRQSRKPQGPILAPQCALEHLWSVTRHPAPQLHGYGSETAFRHPDALYVPWSSVLYAASQGEEQEAPRPQPANNEYNTHSFLGLVTPARAGHGMTYAEFAAAGYPAEEEDYQQPREHLAEREASSTKHFLGVVTPARH